MTILTLFPDTNLFLQCRPLEELAWDDVCGECGEVLLLITRTVQKEVDRLKQDGNSRRAKRARRANSIFRQLIQSQGQKMSLHREVPRVALAFAPAMNVPLPEGLDPNEPDDALIGAALHYKAANSGALVSILSHDTGPALTARRFDLGHIFVPDDWLLPPEPDQRERAFKDIEARIKALESAYPKVELTVTNIRGNETHAIKIDVMSYPALTEPELSMLVAAAKQRFPMSIGVEPKPMLGVGLLKYAAPGKDKVKKYEEQSYPAWVNALSEALQRVHTFLGSPTRFTPLTVNLSNVGSVPAQNCRVEMDVTDGFLLLPPRDRDGKFDLWRGSGVHLPRPPLAPAGRWVSVFESQFSFGSQLAFPGGAWQTAPIPQELFSSLARSGLREDRDINAFYWKGGRPTDPESAWELSCKELRHQVEAEPFDLDVQIQEGSAKADGCLRCRVTASNLHTPVVIRVPIEVAVSLGDTVARTLELINDLRITDGD